jgi:hypothetical protein
MMHLQKQVQTFQSTCFHHIPLHSFHAFLTSIYPHPSDPYLPLSSNSIRLSCLPLTLSFSIKIILYLLCTLSDKSAKFTLCSLSLSPSPALLSLSLLQSSSVIPDIFDRTSLKYRTNDRKRAQHIN